MMISLRDKISRITLGSTIAIATIACLGVVSYWFLNREIAYDDTVRRLTSGKNQQIKELIPSFLLIEQQGAVNLTLEKIRSSESLERLEILEVDHPLLDKCKQRDSFLECPSRHSDCLAIAFPISVGDQQFGYLYKEKPVDTPMSALSLLWVSAGILLFLLSFALVLVYLLNRVTAKQIPESLEKLVHWIEAWLRGKDKITNRELQFSEFGALREKIIEVCKKHENERNKAIVGQISSGILHDIRNDLQSVLAAHSLVEEVSDNPEKRLRRIENLNKVLKTKIPNMKNIVETALDVNREISLKNRFADIEKTVRASIEELQYKIDEAGAEITVEETVEELGVYHDATQVKRIMTNLLTNSLDAINAHKVNRKRMHIRFERAGTDISIKLEDSGPGIEIDRDDLFAAFKTSKSEGTGLGLFNAQKIMSAHGGFIRNISPKYLSGACFEIVFPGEGYYGNN